VPHHSKWMYSLLATAVMVVTLAACGEDKATHSGTGTGGGSSDSCDSAALSAVADDHSDLSDEELSQLATRFIHGWRSVPESQSTPSRKVEEAVRCELEKLSISPYAASYYPDLRTIMVLGGGGSRAVRITQNGEPTELDPAKYYEPDGNGHFQPKADRASEIDEQGLLLEECSTGELLRVGPGTWADLESDPNGRFSGGVAQDEIVHIRDLGSTRTCEPGDGE
jgi:hypothetical protein